MTVTNASKPFWVVSKAFAVVGKFADCVSPATKATPAELTAIAMAPVPESYPAPPRNVEYTNDVPEEFSFVTKTSENPLIEVSNAPAVTGKSAEMVLPAITALP